MHFVGMPEQGERLVAVVEGFKDKNVPITDIIYYLNFAFS
jgi:hypothetical protein